jgi:hypothetical protein
MIVAIGVVYFLGVAVTLYWSGKGIRSGQVSLFYTEPLLTGLICFMASLSWPVLLPIFIFFGKR